MPITNPDKVLFPEAGIRKKALFAYYRLIAPYMLPHVAGRPLSLVRFPDGSEGGSFYQKEARPSMDEAFTRIDVRIDKEPRQYLSADTPEAIAAFGSLVAEPHIWISKAPDYDFADIAVWDIDPPEGMSFEHVRVAARLVKAFLENLGASPHAKLTGSRGIHVSVTLDGLHSVSDVFALTRSVSERLAKTLPDVFTTEFSRDRRGNRIYLDYLRNRYAQSFAAPYAVRARPTAPVAVPIRWDDLDGYSSAGDITVADIPAWLQTNKEWVIDWAAENSDFEAMRDRMSGR
jgi:bifunctional non-homologous end joining protein LigD